MQLKSRSLWVIVLLIGLLLFLSGYYFTATADPTPDPATRPASETVSDSTQSSVPNLPPVLPPNPTTSFADIFSEVNPVVVLVHTDLGDGSGFIFDKDGLVLTNGHVVGATSVVDVVFGSGLTVTGRVIGKDETLDVAVIKVDVAGDLPALVLGDSDRLEQGEDVVVIGYPLWSRPSQKPTITKGVVSARPELGGIEFIQTDSTINLGNSGGPLINSKGQVVGIVTAKVEQMGGRRTEGIGLAVPINNVKNVLPGLRAKADPAGTLTSNPTPALTSAATATRPAGWHTYRNRVHNYSIDVVPGWSVDDEDKSNVVIESPGGVAFLEVTAVVNPGHSLDALTDELVEFLRKEPKALFEVVSRSGITLTSGLKASRVVYRWQGASQHCVEQVTAALVLADSQTFGLAGEVCEHSVDLYQADLERMQDSLAAGDTKVSVTHGLTKSPQEKSE